MVVDVHRALLYGSIFGYPNDKKSKSGKLRLLYEALPIFFVFDRTTRHPDRVLMSLTGWRYRYYQILDLVPSIHWRTSVFLGSKEDALDLIKFYKKYSADAKP
jgi:fructose-1,6-bisphosphatase I